MPQDHTRTITARFASVCATCGEPIEVGEKIARKENRNGWKARGWNHARCEVTWLCDGRTIPGSGGVALHVAINALGERVADNSNGVLEGIAAYAPDGLARARARDGLEATTGSRDPRPLPLMDANSDNPLEASIARARAEASDGAPAKFIVEMGVKGAYRIVTKEFDSRDDAIARAERWAASNSQGSYWAEVHFNGARVAAFNLR